MVFTKRTSICPLYSVSLHFCRGHFHALYSPLGGDSSAAAPRGSVRIYLLSTELINRNCYMTLRLSRCTVGELSELSERRGMCHCSTGDPFCRSSVRVSRPWVLRPCGPERPIWHARYTSSENTSRKFRLGAHLKKYGTESFRRAVNN